MDGTETNRKVTPEGLELANRLEQLLQLPLAASADVDPWTDACFEVQAWLYAHGKIKKMPFALPTSLMFYFHDPDIRAKEPEYKTHQENAVRRLIRQLRGEEPPDIERRWGHWFVLVIIAVLLALLIRLFMQL